MYCVCNTDENDIYIPSIMRDSQDGIGKATELDGNGIDNLR